MLPELCEHHCFGHGLCDPATGDCSCDAGYSGRHCESGLCPHGCSGHGRCVGPTLPQDGVMRPRSIGPRPTGDPPMLSVLPSAGGCECYSGWTGYDCAHRTCPGNNCFGHGDCLNGTCVCESGYAGAACTEAACATPCLNGGVCAPGGRCRCPAAFAGDDCSISRRSRLWRLMTTLLVPPSPPPPPPPRPATDDAPPCAGYGVCSGHGACLAGGTCACQPGWLGAGCAERACTHVSCDADHGRCVHGVCRCREPWHGARCELGRCPRDCSGPGACSACHS